jgi:threonine dehydrogenase-like Zn-dependent dehydrogenase
VITRAFWATSPGRGGLQEVSVRDPGPDDVRVKTSFSGVSRGTESLVFQGRVPESQQQAMRCPHQEGSFSFPIKYGYITVGIVESEGELQGASVFCLHPHQEHFVVPKSDVVCLPDGLDPGRAVLAANMETAINGVWDANPQPGELISVIGAGVVGTLVAWRIRQSTGAEVQLIDRNPNRAALAHALGLDFSLPENAKGEQNLIVHASGSAEGLRKALDLAAPEGRIIEMSWFGDTDITLPLGGAFHSRRLTIRSSQVGQISPRMRAEWSYQRRMRLALDLLREHSALDELINEESLFSDLPETMVRLTSGPCEVLCHRIVYEESN